MSRLSGTTLGNKALFETSDAQKEYVTEKIYNNPEFTIRKRPQSLSNLSKNNSCKNINSIRKLENPEKVYYSKNNR